MGTLPQLVINSNNWSHKQELKVIYLLTDVSGMTACLVQQYSRCFASKFIGTLDTLYCILLYVWLVSVAHQPETVISRAWVQSQARPNKLFQEDFWRVCFEISFSNGQEGLTVSSIICL